MPTETDGLHQAKRQARSGNETPQTTLDEHLRAVLRRHPRAGVSSSDEGWLQSLASESRTEVERIVVDTTLAERFYDCDLSHGLSGKVICSDED
jgi:hypothetical protein